MTRQQDVLDARAAADDWATERGLPPSGGYSGPWYQRDYLGGWWSDGWLKWWANYSVPAGSILSGDVVAHQYTSTPIDSDVMLESEIVTGGIPPVDDTERAAMQEKIDGLVNMLGLLCGNDLKPLTRKTAAQYVKTFVAQARAIAEQAGVSHA